MGAVYWYIVTPKHDVSPLTSPANLFHRYRIRLKGIDTHPPDEHKQLQIGYDKGDCVWVKIPNGQCTSPYTHWHVTVVISLQNVLVDGMPRHIRDLRPIMGSNTFESRSDSELSTQSARTIIINEARSDPPEVGNPDETDDTSADGSSNVGNILL